MTLEQEHPGSVASTNAKAALGLRLAIGTAIISALGFLYSVVSGNENLAENILQAWLFFFAAYLGINTYQRKVDRDTDYKALAIKAGSAGGEVPAPPPGAAATTVEQAAGKTTTTVVTGAADTTVDDPEPVQQWADGRAPDAGIL